MSTPTEFETRVFHIVDGAFMEKDKTLMQLADEIYWATDCVDFKLPEGCKVTITLKIETPLSVEKPQGK